MLIPEKYYFLMKIASLHLGLVSLSGTWKKGFLAKQCDQ